MSMTRVVSGLFGVILLTMVGACTDVITERDLYDLKTPNTFVKRSVIERIQRSRNFPFSLMDSLIDTKREKEAVAVMLELLRSGKEPKDIRRIILKSFGTLGQRTEIPVRPLLDALKDEDPRIRYVAIEVIGKTKQLKAVDALIKLLGRTMDQDYAVLWALGEIGGDKALPVLNRMAFSDNEYLRYNAFKALSKISLSWVPETESNSGLVYLANLGRLAVKSYQESMKVALGKMRNKI